MAKRIFISFPIEDDNLRDLLVGQARLENSPFEFVDRFEKKVQATCLSTLFLKNL